jgi:hypothetical protein
MKLLIVIGVVILLIVLGIAWLYRNGTTTTDQVIATVSSGADRLVMRAIHTSHWGNSYAGRAIFFNEKLVDFRGSLLQKANESGKIFPLKSEGLRVDTLNETETHALTRAEVSHQQATFLEGTAPLSLLQRQNPDLNSSTPWTVWVDPKEFTEAEYERMIEIFRLHAAIISEQQQRFEMDKERNPNAWQQFPTLNIWRIVYHDYHSLENEVFERKNGKTEEKVVIAPHGAAEFRHKSERYQYGYGCGLGHLNEHSDTLFISKVWEINDVAFPFSEFAQFKNKQGQALTEVYKVAMTD